MLRCRRCRKGIIHSTCLSVEVEATDEGSGDACNIWHIRVDTLPEWILTSVLQAQWTVGKLNCQNCAARLGGFNFINRIECPCGRDATVHLNKSRVDPDHKHSALIVLPRKMSPRQEQAGPLTDGCPNKEWKDEVKGAGLDSLHLNCAAVMSRSSHVEASNSLSDRENIQSLSFSPLPCLSHRRQCYLEDATPTSSSCYYPVDTSAVKVTRARTSQSTESSVTYPTSLEDDIGGDASFSIDACHALVSGRTQPPLHPVLLQTVEDVKSSSENASLHKEVSHSASSLRGRSISDSVAEQDEQELPQAFTASQASNSLSKRERNHLKGLRRKQRRRERWLHSRLEQEQAERVSGSQVSGSQVSGGEADAAGLTCAVCLDIYFSPYSCQPCGHIFCEPCLRTLAKNQRTRTPCPLCRALISNTNFHGELDQKAKTFFSNVYHIRKMNFNRAWCAKWPLPSSRERFRTFWASVEQRRVAMAERPWYSVLGDFTLEASDLTDTHRWLFDVFPNSVNWILAFLFSCVLVCYFFG